MLSIRLTRTGRKKAPTYRVVVMPKHRDPWGRVIEILGHYNPRTNPRTLVLKADRIKHWLSQGAECTDTVWNLLVDEKIVDGKKQTASHLTKKRRGKLAEKETAKREAEEAAKAAEAEAKAKAKEEAEAAKAAEAAKEEAPAEEPAPETSEDAPSDDPTPSEDAKPEEPAAEEPAEEAKEETPAE